MTDIEQISQAVWGDNWRRPLAKYLDVEYRTLRRWLSGDAHIPEGVLREIERLTVMGTDFHYEFDQLPVVYKDVTLAYIRGCCQVVRMDDGTIDVYDICIFSQGPHKEVRGVYLPESADSMLIINSVLAHLRMLHAAGALHPTKGLADD